MRRLPTPKKGAGETRRGPKLRGACRGGRRDCPFGAAGLEAAPAPEEEVAPAPGDAVAATVPAEEDATAGASEAAHAAELEATPLAASSPGVEGPAEAAVDATVSSVEATEASAVLNEAAVGAEGAEV
jgi:hypothetical protein